MIRPFAGYRRVLLLVKNIVAGLSAKMGHSIIAR